MSKRCIVVVSEYEAPNDFITIWEREIIQNMNKRLDTNTQLEKLFAIKDSWWKGIEI